MCRTDIAALGFSFLPGSSLNIFEVLNIRSVMARATFLNSNMLVTEPLGCFYCEKERYNAKRKHIILCDERAENIAMNLF